MKAAFSCLCWLNQILFQCDFCLTGWTLVLKVVSHADQGLVLFGDVLNSTWPIKEYKMEAISITNQYKGHYKNQVYFDGNWESFNASQVGPLSGLFFRL